MNGHSDDGGAPESPAVEADAEETIVEPVIKGGAPDEIDDEYTGRRNRKRPCQRFPIVEVSPSKKKTKQEINETRANCRVADDMSWICMECKEAEVLDDAVELIVCEGKCYRPFHTACVGLLNTPEDAWSCSDCKAERHVCSICQEFGIDDVDVFLCKQKACGLFFHESCLTSNNVDIKQVEKTTGGENGIDVPETRPEFKCPAHQCWTCTEEIVIKDEEEKVAKKGKAKKKRGKKQDNAFAVKNGQLFRCLECCIAYHVSCIPPFAKFHELALLCHDHAPICKLPYLDMESSYQGKLEKAADKKMENLEKGFKRGGKNRNETTEEKNIFFLGLRGETITKEEGKLLSHVETYIEKNDDEVAPSQLLDLLFCLPCDLKNEVHSKPPSFRLVHTLRYNQSNRPKRKDPPGEACKCTTDKQCDENCHNRHMCIECTGDASKGNGDKNPYWNCDAGLKCGNRALGLRQSAKCKPQREQGKGWGLVTLEPLEKGDLVQEYVGEVIDEKTKTERLQAWSEDHPNDPNFYIMQLEAGWYIDARVEANLSRFINHSCAPNCILRPVSVAGYSRNGIYAAKDLAAGEFLSYDYQFDTKHGDKFVCRCGADKCRGTMKGGKQLAGQDDEQKTLKQALAAAKAREEKDRKYLEDVQRIHDTNFSLVDVMIPASDYPGEAVALGPHERYRTHDANNRVFLWRNCVIGANFSNRALLLDRPRRKPRRRAECVQVNVLAKLAALTR